MESLIEKANRGGYVLTADNRQHWKYDWFTPLKKNEVSQERVNMDPNSMENEESKYPFKYKTWLKADVSDFHDNKEELDVLDLSKYDRTKKLVVTNGVSVTEDDQSSLTMADIRGAVGGSESIPGLSKTDAVTEQPAVTIDASVTETNTPAPTEELQELKETPVEEQEEPKDVSMDNEESNDVSANNDQDSNNVSTTNDQEPKADVDEDVSMTDA
ncbi:hypothetical protein Kpol_1028p70 [Vanderwaltozyma polyspora DSM 70294]|uniref:Uncharacterized protein n=1 Tax=Vanderwaltozyma polyspora (strain ATCC 22028 / DSM 70294 / BCRC 21397 / CBS 2163 / NBRC 10782 / NRRL Y-8283 / UCD 57-17) TaxID=436907 RepID=A7TG38_VANPO|nr:uncharacterized protein Kpol_1028p70 [Vanderwaltozyma polyspora DSM 70294]EDO18795.1 hypothetical protein Kpol_1028p70 [Vanderwaltozyma polyspora DSM 70294]